MAKVFVGLSGGVDSAVSARLLMDAGRDVTGVFIKIWQPEFFECTWEEDRLAAKRVAAALGIPFLEIDLSEEYKNSVIADMLAGYAKGITPNPDVLCNRAIKFGAFRTWARAHGAEKIATGHYARVVEKNGVYELHRGVDDTKDQSYFLHRLKQEDLRDALFPIGGYTKKQVRVLAQKFRLPNAARKDSQGLCFVGNISIGEFLGRFIPLTEGDVLDMSGQVIGKHSGAARYTLGERHGFSVAADSPHAAPLYVVRIDVNANTLTVSPDIRDAKRLRVRLRDLSWVSRPAEEGESYTIDIRYHARPCRGELKNGELILKEAALLSPGQSAVFYDGPRCLGGAIIT